MSCDERNPFSGGVYPKSPEAQILALGWEHGAADTMTPEIRQRLVASGLPLHVAG